MCDIVCAKGAASAPGVDRCNQRVGARYRLRSGLLDCCSLRGGVLDCSNQRGVCDIVCVTAAIKGGCAISSARGRCCNQRQGARYRLRGVGAGLLQSKGVRDLVCAGGGAKAGCAISSAQRGQRLRRGGAGLPQSKGGCAISSAQRVAGLLQSKDQRGVCDIVCVTAAIKGGVRDTVCGGWVLDCFNQRGGARYRLRGGVLDPDNQKGGARYRLRGGCWTAAIQGVGARYRLRGGVLDCCNERGGAR